MRLLSRRPLTVALLGLVTATTIAVGIYGTLAGPTSSAPRAPSGGIGSSTPRDLATAAAPTAPQAAEAAARPAVEVIHTTNPILYVRAVTKVLFDWDTTTGYLPTDYTAPVLADADPSGDETPGLITDVATYLPTTEEWLDLATMDVAQSITVTTARVPADWPTILDQAHGQLRPGTTAVTVTGARHRIGVWDGQPAASLTPVAFTAFVACPPAFDRCHLLRLSQLGDPLN